MQYALRLLSDKYSDFVYCAEVIFDYFSFLETGVPLHGVDYFKAADEAKRCACHFGIKATKSCNSIKTPITGVRWCKNGITRSTLHCAFDETVNSYERIGPIRIASVKTFEKYIGKCRRPVLQHGGVNNPEFYSKCTQKNGEMTALQIVTEKNMYDLYYLSI